MSQNKYNSYCVGNKLGDKTDETNILGETEKLPFNPEVKQIPDTKKIPSVLENIEPSLPFDKTFNSYGNFDYNPPSNNIKVIKNEDEEKSDYDKVIKDKLDKSNFFNKYQTHLVRENIPDFIPLSFFFGFIN